MPQPPAGCPIAHELAADQGPTFDVPPVGLINGPGPRGLLLFGLYAPQVFHATGHRCQFSALQYNSAFVGFESFSWWRGAALLTLNTYASHVLSVLLVVCLYSKQHVKKQGTALLAFGFAFSLRTIAVMACASLHPFF